MAPANESILLIPLQRIHTPIRSHDREGNRLLPLLAAGEPYIPYVFEVSGNADMEIFNRSDVRGVLRIWMTPSFLSLDFPGPVPGTEVVRADYDPPDFGMAFKCPCLARYILISYTNDTTAAQTIWEFSVQFRPIGSN
jgi:hypothetical protein